MLRRLVPIFAAWILLLPFAFAVGDVGSLEVATGLLNATIADTVQVAGSHLPEEGKMPKEWKGVATVEVYMASDVVNNVGYVTGPMMYNLIQQTLRSDCRDTVGGVQHHECWGEWHPFDTRYRKNNGKVEDTTNQVHVKSSRYKNMQVRNLLIGALAAAYEESTKMMRNCFYADDAEVGYRYCNAPLRVGAYTEDSHILMELTSDIENDNDGSWHCCETREFVDVRLDELMGEFKSVYPTGRSKSRSVECHLGCGDDQRESNVHVDKLLIELMNNGL